jgi:radical SAM superfamily enzyme
MWACSRNESDNRQLVKEFFCRQRPKAEKFIAYFQTFTNTYTPAEMVQVIFQGLSP